MNSRQRLWAALHHQPVDRVPANVTYYMGGFARANFSYADGEDHWRRHLGTYTRFGFDPLIGVGGSEAMPWRLSDPRRWDVQVETDYTAPGLTRETYTVHTPAGMLRTVYGDEPGESHWQIEPLVKGEEDLAAFAYLPGPKADIQGINRNVRRLGDEGLGFVSVNGIWQQACYIRRMEEMATDPFVRPEWTRRYLDIVGGYLAQQAEALCRSEAEALFINESYLGMGMSRAMFDEFVRPYDERLIQIARRSGKLVLYHDCGKGNALLERFVDMGISYLETVNPRAASGDMDPADVKRRIGGTVCLRGGFNHHLISRGTPEEIEQEVVDCLRTLARGGGYILCPAGPIENDTPMANLVAFAEAAQRHCGDYGAD